MKTIAYDPFPKERMGIEYVNINELLAKSDIISLHCPLTSSTRYIINDKSIKKMKDGVFIINTSRGQLIDSDALLQALKSGKIHGAGLDVYEEETAFFFEDYSSTVIDDDVLSILVSMPNVVMTSHQAFLTEEALQKIAEVTIFNLKQFYNGEPLKNKVEYKK